MTTNGPTIMTLKEVATYLRLHETSIYRMCKQGTIPAYKVGRSWRFKKEKIDQWLLQSGSIDLNIEVQKALLGIKEF